MLSLMMECLHSKVCAYSSAEKGKKQKCLLGNTPHIVPRPVLVYSVGKECYYTIILRNSIPQSYHQHYAPLGEAECFAMGLDGIPYLFDRYRLAVLTDRQAPAVDLRSKLFCLHPTIPLGKKVKNGFLDFHLRLIISTGSS